MKMLSLLDDLFFWFERPHQPMHVAGLMVFDVPKGAPENFISELAARLHNYNQPTTPFDRRLRSAWWGHAWEKAKYFSIEKHFQHVVLPKFSRPEELYALIANEHRQLLSRERPLWQCYLLESVDSRSFALYIKVHHSLLDGVSGIRTVTKMLSHDPALRNMAPVWQLQPVKKARRSAFRLPNIGKLWQQASDEITALPPALKAVFDQERRKVFDADFRRNFSAPISRFNQPVSGDRQFTARSLSRARFKAIAQKVGGTTNDVVLAVCGGALRAYLLELNDLPRKSLVAMVPVSLRKNDSVGGNQVGVLLANLATEQADPVGRLARVRHSMDLGKARFNSLSSKSFIDYLGLTLAPSGLSLLTGHWPSTLAFNVVISNVPGPDETQYWNGAQLKHIYPVSAVADNLALNITVIRYAEQLEFGVLACRNAVPNADCLAVHLERSLVALEQALGLVPVTLTQGG